MPVLGEPINERRCSAREVADVIVVQARVKCLQEGGQDALETFDRDYLCLTEDDKARLAPLMNEVHPDQTLEELLDIAHRRTE